MVPHGITREHVLKAADDFQRGVQHRFADSIRYDVVIDGHRYPPKAIVGLAARHATGAILSPDDFSGGVGSSCFRLLRRLGFDIVLKSNADNRSAALTIGRTYSRADLYEILDVPAHKQGGGWDTGYHRHGDEYFIFCGIGTAGRTGHDYGNHFDGNELVWFGKPGSKYHHASIQAMISGDLPVHVPHLRCHHHAQEDSADGTAGGVDRPRRTVADSSSDGAERTPRGEASALSSALRLGR